MIKMNYEQIWNSLTIKQKQYYAMRLQITRPDLVPNQKWNELVPIAKSQLKPMLINIYWSPEKIETFHKDLISFSQDFNLNQKEKSLAIEFGMLTVAKFEQMRYY